MWQERELAAGIVPLAHASDGGGSIRIPASAAGLFGLKPSRGRCVAASTAGSGFDVLLSEGCISRSVRDSALFLALVEAEGGGLPRLGHVREASGKKLRIGAWATALLGTEPDAEVRRAFDETIALCKQLGHEVVPTAPPAVDGAALSRAYFSLAGRSLGRMVEMMEMALCRRVGADDLEHPGHRAGGQGSTLTGYFPSSCSSARAGPFTRVSRSASWIAW